MDDFTTSEDSNSEESANSSSQNYNQESKKYNPFIEFEESPSHFTKLGFWAALNNVDNPRKAFDELIQSYITLLEDRRLDLNFSHSFDVERFEEQVLNAEDQTDEIAEKLREQQSEVPALNKEARSIRDRIIGLEKKLTDAYQKLGNAKINLIDNRIRDAFNELNNLIDKYREITKKHREVNQDAKEGNNAFEIKPDFLEQLKASYHNALENIQKKTVSLGLKGNWLMNPWYLQIFGLLAAYASGYFFSIFAIKSNLGNVDITFFILTGLFNFVGGVTLASPWVGHAIVIGLIILLPIMFLLISYFCQRALEKREEKQEKKLEDLKVTVNENNEIQIKNIAEINDFYSFLLKRLPFLYIVCVIFAFVAFGYFGALNPSFVPNPTLNNLSTSLSGFMVGVNLSLAFSGIIYIYILNVIEPRQENSSDLDQEEESKKRKYVFRSNIELIAVILLSLALFFVLLIGLEKYFLFDISKVVLNKVAFIALLLFTLSLLITAFTFGYGMYFSGIIEAKVNTERQLRFITQKLAYNRFPSIKPALIADKTFGTKYIEIVNKLLDLISNKTDLAGKFVPKKESQSKQKQENAAPFFNFLPRRIRKYFSDNRSEGERLQDHLRELDERVDLPPEDEYYFPEIASEINSLDARIKENKKRLLTTEADIRNRKEEKSDHVLNLKADKIKLEEKTREWNKHLSFLHREQFKEVERFNRKHQKELTELNDGFNLALWFIAGGGQPPQLESIDKAGDTDE